MKLEWKAIKEAGSSQKYFSEHGLFAAECVGLKRVWDWKVYWFNSLSSSGRSTSKEAAFDNAEREIEEALYLLKEMLK